MPLELGPLRGADALVLTGTLGGKAGVSSEQSLNKVCDVSAKMQRRTDERGSCAFSDAFMFGCTSFALCLR